MAKGRRVATRAGPLQWRPLAPLNHGVVRLPASRRVTRLIANLVGAAGAGVFAWSVWHHYVQTHSLIGAAFFAEELWIVLVYVLRRPAVKVSTRTDDWLFAFAGTFGGVLFRPSGLHSHLGIVAGAYAQALGLALCVVSFAALGRSFGFAPADRGLKRRGPYGVVRHPIYASYVLLVTGYVLQSLSWSNLAVMILVCGADVGRIRGEERLLAAGGDYAGYRVQVRWRVVPGLW